MGPTGMGEPTTVLVAVLITDTVPSFCFIMAPYTLRSMTAMVRSERNGMKRMTNEMPMRVIHEYPRTRLATE